MSKREDLHAQLSLIQLPVETGVCNVLQFCCNPLTPSFLFNWPFITSPVLPFPPSPQRPYRYASQASAATVWSLPLGQFISLLKTNTSTQKLGQTNVGKSFLQNLQCGKQRMCRICRKSSDLLPAWSPAAESELRIDQSVLTFATLLCCLSLFFFFVFVQLF